MGLALGPAFGRAELAVWGGWGARVRFARGDPSQGGALPAARPMLYGLPFRLSLWHRRRSPFACRNPVCPCVAVWCVRPGVGINILMRLPAKQPAARTQVWVGTNILEQELPRSTLSFPRPFPSDREGPYA